MTKQGKGRCRMAPRPGVCYTLAIMLSAFILSLAFAGVPKLTLGTIAVVVS
jgi:hypothetical protein